MTYTDTAERQIAELERQLDEAIEQRDALLAACEAALNEFRKLHQQGRLAGTNVQSEGGIMDELHAAIRKVKAPDA